jgi:hypothetical protein
MVLWFCSNVGHAHLEGLIKHGLLRARTVAKEWLMPSYEDVPTPPDGYIAASMSTDSRCLLIRSSRGYSTTTKSSCST